MFLTDVQLDHDYLALIISYFQLWFYRSFNVFANYCIKKNITHASCS
uniref:Uncharacterized protein n=1 Tax=Arundo donax TaxID=35708 RepID=A0A0A9A7H3_ARUDO